MRISIANVENIRYFNDRLFNSLSTDCLLQKSLNLSITNISLYGLAESVMFGKFFNPCLKYVD